MRKVLFVCGHNSGRSQMAQAWMNHLCGDRFIAESAGINPAESVNRHVVRAMAEAGIDISLNKPRSVFAVYKSGETFSYIITVCDQAAAEKCPVFLGLIKQSHWNFPDPAALSGSEEDKMDRIRSIRDSIRDTVLAWCSEQSTSGEAV